MTKQEILTILKQDYNFFAEKDYDILGVFAFGSYNYGVDTDKSDIDAKIICLHKPQEAQNSFFRESPEGQITLYSIDEFLAELEAGHHNCFEILFSDLNFINLRYRNAWKEVQKLSRPLVQEMLSTHLNFISMSLVDLAMRAAFVSKIKFDKFHENKRVALTLRLQNLVMRLMDGENYPDVLMPPKGLREEIIKLKSEAPLGHSECTKLITEKALDTVRLINAFVAKRSENELKDSLFALRRELYELCDRED